LLPEPHLFPQFRQIARVVIHGIPSQVHPTMELWAAMMAGYRILLGLKRAPDYELTVSPKDRTTASYRATAHAGLQGPMQFFGRLAANPGLAVRGNMAQIIPNPAKLKASRGRICSALCAGSERT
jgi:hypothetical protein